MDKKIRPGVLVVKFKAEVSEETKKWIHAKHGGQVLKEISKIGVLVVSVPIGQEDVFSAKYKGEPNVEYAQPEVIARV